MGVTGAGVGRASRALRLALLFVLALAAVEFLFGSILDASPLKTYLYTPGNSSSLARNEKYSSRWPNQVSFVPKEKPSQETVVIIRNSTQNISTIIINPKDIQNNTYITSVDYTNKESLENMTRISNSSIFSNLSNTPLLISKIIDSINDKYNGTTEEIDFKMNVTPEQKKLKLCPQTPPDLGPIEVNKTEIELEWVENKFPAVHWGGRYSPPHCKSRHRVAIIVPYRDRQQHLAIFLNHMHPFLMKQQIEYGIFIIEQSGASDFNRAKLMNVGFIESQKLKADGWKCFIFHDIDLLPLDGRNMYTCPRQPRHMSASIDKLNFRLPYEDIFGGVSAMTKDQFTKVNGFSNKYWGWGGEDDDMFYRLKKKNYHIARYKMSVARYAMLDHKKSSPNPKRYQLLSQTGKTFQKDGLTTLEYELVEVTQHHLYTHILVNIDERS